MLYSGYQEKAKVPVQSTTESEVLMQKFLNKNWWLSGLWNHVKSILHFLSYLSIGISSTQILSVIHW